MTHVPSIKKMLLFVALSLLYAVSGLKAQNQNKTFQPELVIQSGHAAEVLSAAISPNSKILASGDSEKIILWDLETAKILKTLSAPQNGVLALSFSPDGKLLASGGFDSTIILWEVSTGKSLRRLTNHADAVNSLSFSPDGKLLASGSDDATIKLWNIATGDEVRTIPGADYIDLVSFSPDGTMLAACNGTRDSEAEKGKRYFIKIWNVSTGRIIKSFDGFSEEQKALFADSGKLLVQDSDSVRSLKIADGTVLYDSKLKSRISAFALSADREVAVLGDWKGAVTSIKTADGTIINEFEAENNDLITHIQFNRAGNTVASFSLKKVKVWDWQSRKLKSELTARAGQISSLAFSRENSMLAISDYDKSVELWSLIDGERKNLFFDKASDGLESVSVSSKRNLVASGGWNYVKLWNAATGTETKTLRQDVADGNTSILTKVSAVDFSPSENILASAWEDTVQLWDVATGERLMVLKGDTPVKGETVAFSPTGKLLAAGGRDGKIKIWDLNSQKMIYDFSAHPQDVVSSVVFSSDEKSLASVGLNQENIRFWSLETGKELFYETTPDWVEFSGKTALAGIGKRRLRLIINNSEIYFSDFESGEKIGTLVILGDGHWLFATPGGFFDGTPEAQRQILWRFTENLSDIAPVESFYYEFYYPGLLKKVLAGETPRLPDKKIPFEQKDIRQAEIRMCPKCPCTPENQAFDVAAVNDRAELALCLDVTAPANFILNDFTDFKAVAARLVTGNDPVYGFILESFLPDNQTALKKFVAALAENSKAEPDFELRQILRRELNSLIKQPDFAKKCKGLSASLTGATKPSDNGAPYGAEREWLNRMMLESLFRDGIRQGGIRNLESSDGNPVSAAEMETDRKGVCPAGEMCLQDMRLFWNGRLIRRWRGDILQNCEKVSRYRVQCETKIPRVKGVENRYDAYLFNQDRVKSKDAALTLN